MANLFQFVDHSNFAEKLGGLLREDPDFRGVKYGKAFPRNREETPTIRYRLIHRVPGIEHIERRKPRLRLEVIDESGKIVQVWSQWMTCVYQWDVCTSSLEEADEILDKFDRFLRASVGRLLEMGARDFIFDEQVVDEMLPKTKDVETRSLRWVAYLHQIEARVVDPIDQFRIRVLESHIEDVQAVIRGADLMVPDGLNQTYISDVLLLSDPSPSGIARTQDYLPDIDYITIYDPANNKTWIQWIEAGRKPAPGATYYVRYLYWDNWSRLSLPVPL
jgi:hypothetical protein